MANKVKYGLRNVNYSVITTTNGVDTYGTPVPINGAVSLSLAPAGDQVDFFADDSLYFTQSVNQGYTGELVIADLPKTFLTEVLGFTEDSNGALIEDADISTKPFALGYEVQGDDKGTKFWLYNCTCARPNQDAATKENGITPSTDTLAITVAPRLADKIVRAKMVENATNTAAYEAFFTSVYEDTISG